MTNEEILIKCNGLLEEIKPQILSEDRKEAAKQLGVEPITIHRYLNGECKKADFATKLYNFLKNRIEQRIAILS